MSGSDSGVLTPLFDPDAQPPVIDVSDEEEACLVAALGVDAVQGLASAETVTEEVAESVLTCLENETLLRLYLTPFLQQTGPLSAESSTCIRSGFGETDFDSLLRFAGEEQDGPPADEMAMMAGMTTFIVTLSCLDDDEFAKVAPSMECSILLNGRGSRACWSIWAALTRWRPSWRPTPALPSNCSKRWGPAKSRS